MIEIIMYACCQLRLSNDEYDNFFKLMIGADIFRTIVNNAWILNQHALHVQDTFQEMSHCIHRLCDEIYQIVDTNDQQVLNNFQKSDFLSPKIDLLMSINIDYDDNHNDNVNDNYNTDNETMDKDQDTVISSPGITNNISIADDVKMTNNSNNDNDDDDDDDNDDDNDESEGESDDSSEDESIDGIGVNRIGFDSSKFENGKIREININGKKLINHFGDKKAYNENIVICTLLINDDVRWCVKDIFKHWDYLDEDECLSLIVRCIAQIYHQKG